MRCIADCLAVCLACGTLLVGCDRKSASLPTGGNGGGPPQVAAAKVDDHAADRKWVREVAEAFLSAAGSGSFQQGPASAYLSLRFQEQLGKQTSWFSYRFAKWSISSEAMSPAGDEAIFKGAFESIIGDVKEDGSEKTKTHDFTLLIRKEKEDGKWRVDSFHY